jgi:hypothetical protein
MLSLLVALAVVGQEPARGAESSAFVEPVGTQAKFDAALGLRRVAAASSREKLHNGVWWYWQPDKGWLPRQNSQARPRRQDLLSWAPPAEETPGGAPQLHVVPHPSPEGLNASPGTMAPVVAAPQSPYGSAPVHPGYANPGFAFPGLAHPALSPPGFSHPGFSHPAFNRPGFGF